jgi:hypothetical protein
MLPARPQLQWQRRPRPMQLRHVHLSVCFGSAQVIRRCRLKCPLYPKAGRKGDIGARLERAIAVIAAIGGTGTMEHLLSPT